MIPMGWLIFSAVCGVAVFVRMFFSTAGDKPSFGVLMEEDKKARLQFYPTETENRDGFIELSGDTFCFKDADGKNIISVPYSCITRCTTNTSTVDTGKLVFAQPSWGSAYHYLNIVYIIDEVSKELAFRFNGPAFPYVKELCSRVNSSLKKSSIKKETVAQASPRSSAEVSIPSKPIQFIVFDLLLFFAIITSAPSLINSLWVIFNPPAPEAGADVSFWLYILYNLIVASVYMILVLRVFVSGSRKDWGRRLFLYIVMFEVFNIVIKNIFIVRSFAPGISATLFNLAILYYFTRGKVKEVFER